MLCGSFAEKMKTGKAVKSEIFPTLVLMKCAKVVKM